MTTSGTMPDMDPIAEIARLRAENDALCLQLQVALETIKVMQQRQEELEAQLAQDSHNSNWPSSRDKGHKVKRTRSLRQKSGKKAGGQVGHRGQTLEMVAEPDGVVVHRPERCACCAQELPDWAENVAVERRQVIDIPPLQVEVIEHQVQHVRCPACQQVTNGSFPAVAGRPIQYGPHLRAVSVYLNQHHLLPLDRLSQALNDLFSVSISPGSVIHWVEQAGTQVTTPVSAIKTGLRQAPVLHNDETGLYIAGDRHWLHVASTAYLTYYYPHAKRGTAGMLAMGILPQFHGRSMHDNWAAYAAFACQHGLCNAHHLRELTYLEEEFHQTWASDFKTLLLDGKALADTARSQGHSALSAEQLQTYEKRYQTLIDQALSATAPPPEGWPKGKRGRPKKTKARNLAERLDAQREAVLAFMHDLSVPFDNNLAERDIRMLKVQQKISGCFRSWTGAQAACNLRSYLSTMRKQGHSVYGVLCDLFAGTTLMPRTTY
jgi:transposase